MRRTPSSPAYLRRMLALAQRVPRGTLAHALIEHDDGCAQLAGRGPCDCEATITLVTREQRKP